MYFPTKCVIIWFCLSDSPMFYHVRVYHHLLFVLVIFYGFDPMG